jgi:site-specific DNA recombinase
MVEAGRFRGGNAPYGYRLEKSGILNKRKHEVYKLVIDEDEARIVRMMFDLCVSSGFGRWRLANFLNEQGIKNRKGQNWHDASIGGILHNPMYKGILRSGETYSKPFKELQIIKPELFDMAQRLMLERSNERKEHRTVPLNTTGQSLLSGNVFCGHCGGRLVLTTNGTVTRKADGTTIQRKRIRYVCYNKTRRRQECSGQTGYTMHILDDMITEILHQVFDKMKAVSGEQVVGLTLQQQMNELQADLSKAKSENVKANKEYEALKSELLKTIQGKSELPKDVLSEMLEEARNKVLESSKRVTDLTLQLEQKNGIIADMQAEYDRIASWSEIFDQSDMAVKKMICSYIIERVVVHRGYELEVKFNINVEQFLNGIDSVTEELQIAQ